MSDGTPQTRLAAAVAGFAARSYPPFLAHHCERSFELALLIAAADGVAVDREVLYAGILLHDIALTRRFHSTSVRFEVASAEIARRFVREHGMSRRRADNVWDVVALHGTGDIALHKSAETAVACDAIGTDVTGLGLDRFPKDAVNRIMATRPGFTRPFVDAIVSDLQDKPHCASGTWMAPIAAEHIPSFQSRSVERVALENPYEGA